MSAFNENVLAAFYEVDEAVCSIFGSAPASLVPRSLWLEVAGIELDRKLAAEDEAADFAAQQEAEIRAEMSAPQHLVW